MNLKDNVEQLLSYLTIYENLIEQGIFEERDCDQIDEFNMRLHFLKELIQNNESRLFEYNYEKLREIFSLLFWGKDFSEIFEESKSVFIKTMVTFDVILECIETLQRENGNFLPYFDPTIEDIWELQNNGSNVEYIDFYDTYDVPQKFNYPEPKVGENYGEWRSRFYAQQNNPHPETTSDEKIYVLKIDSFNKNGLN